MAFCFKRKESVAKAIRRLGRERIESALECLKDDRHAEAIHCARKDIKKVRAVARLARDTIDNSEFRHLTRSLRKAASQLAGPRDAYVKARTLKNLARHYHRPIQSGVLRGLHSQLRRAFDAEMKQFTKEDRAKSVEHILRRVSRDFEDLNIDGKGWKAIRPGVQSAYRRGRRAYQSARQDSSPEHLHAWRKRVKDLGYQINLLQPMWPEQLEAMACELESLGEHLGDAHDLFALQQSLPNAGDDQARKETTDLKKLIAQRQRELRTAAFAVGKRFYAEKPGAFCARLAKYWRAWRRGKKPARFARA
jgi:CHAD domain-containing protein